MHYFKKILLFLYLSSTLYGLTITPITTTEKSQLTNGKKIYFGEQLFQGNFTNKSQFRQNPSYILKIGDIINITIWGAYEFKGDITIDSKGNIFIPQIGTANLLGLKNSELQSELEKSLKEIFNDNVKVYANIKYYQPLSIFVSGSVNKVGLYDGFSNDSILQFIDKAGGIIKGEGSYRNIYILRNREIVKKVDLYPFLIDGYIDDFEFNNGDMILVKPMQNFVEVDGDVNRPYIFELKRSKATVKNVMKYVLPKAGVNRFTHTKLRNRKEISTSYSIKKAYRVRVRKGEKITFYSNYYLDTVRVSIEGEHRSVKYMSIKKGTSLYRILRKIRFSRLSNIKNIQLFRQSIAKIQQKLLDSNLKDLEARALTSDSASSEEATIRNKEAELILKFIERAKKVQFKGQVVLSSKEDLRYTILEDGDRIYIPKKSNIITIQGEVSIPNAITYKKNRDINYYINSCGGYTKRADRDKILLVKANGKVIQYDDNSFFAPIAPKVTAGDSILVLGKTETKSLLLTKDITQIIYQMAVSAAVIVNSF